MGGRSLAARCLKLLLKDKRVEVVGVVTREERERLWYGKEPVLRLVKKHNLKTISEKNVLNMDVDLGFSILHWNILTKDVIGRFKEGIINLHPAPLPRYRGCWTYQRAIINGDKEFAMTLHYIDEGVDSGDVIKVEWFKITPEMAVKDVYNEALKAGYRLFKDMLPCIIDGSVRRVTQKELISKGERMHFSLAKAYGNKEVDLNWPPEKLYNFVRAMDFPVNSVTYKYEPAYIIVNGRKIYLTVTPVKTF